MRSRLAWLACLSITACTPGATATDDAASSATNDAATTSDAAASTTDAAPDCSGTDAGTLAACGAQAFLATLSATDQDTVLYDFDDATNKTCWSNLPGQNRPGITFGALSSTSRAAAMALAHLVLSDDGYEDLRGVLAADDYLGTQSGSGMGPGGAGTYTSDNAHIAIFGTPGTGDWMLSIGNHHLAIDVTFVSGTGWPTPNHLGAEPRTEFTVNGETFGPLVSEGDAMIALFGSLSATDLASAHLSGTFGDVVLGPVEYCTGDDSRVVFPTGSERGGVLVSSLSSDQQALVRAAIAEWVEDYQPAISDPLMASYTASDAYADTLIAWGGSESAPDVTINGTYFRIDGPRVWIELAVQNGVVLSGTHYHTIYRDRMYDYGGEL